MRIKNLLHPEIWIGLLVLLALSLPFVFSNLDLTLSAFFYRAGWPLEDRQPWLCLYRYGTWPGIIISAAALIFWLGRFLHPFFKTWQRPAALLVLTMLLAPGLLVNALGKGYYGRPRPRDVVQFGGTETFHRFIQPGIPGQGKSFPCGHASVGFFLMALYFTDPRRGRQWLWLASGALLGITMGIGRMAAGGHFASDVLWAGGVTYLTAALLHHVVLADPHAPPRNRRLTWRQRLWGGLGIAVGLILLAVFFLLATPYDKQWQGETPAAPEIRYVRLAKISTPEKVTVETADQIPAVAVQARLRGFGFPKLKLTGQLAAETQGATLTAHINLALDRWVTERQGQVTIKIRRNLQWFWEDQAGGPQP